MPPVNPIEVDNGEVDAVRLVVLPKESKGDVTHFGPDLFNLVEVRMPVS